MAVNYFEKWKYKRQLTIREVVYLMDDTPPHYAEYYEYCPVIESLIFEAIGSGEINAVMPTVEGEPINNALLFPNEIKTWLNKIGYPSEFFGTPYQNNDTQPYLDPINPNYSTELAAAVNAWVTVNDGFGNPSATFKQRIIEALEISNPDFDFALNSSNKYTKEVDRISTICNPDTAKK